MPRRCLVCQTVIDDGRLVACPNPQCPSHFGDTAQALPLSQDQVDRIVKAVTDDLSKSGPTLDKLAKPVASRIFKNVHWWITFPVVYLALFGVSYYRIQTGLQELLISRVAKQFGEPHIRETLQEVAENQVSKMLKDEIQPAVDRFRADLQNEYQTLSEEVSRLRIQNNLPILSDRATSQGDREALEEIHRIAQTTPENSPLKKSALDLYINVLRSLYNQYYASPFLTVTLGDGSVKTESEIPTSRLMTSLFDADWKVRTRATMLLGNRTENGVPDSLLHVARTDKDLRVVSNALISFGYVTRRINKPRLAVRRSLT